MKRPGVVTRGTARDLADNGAGYSCNGESQYSRNAAQPNVRMAGNSAKTTGKHTQAALIAENESQLAKLRGDISLETDPTRREKLKKNFDIKARFVARLKAE